jgi:RimJ/RimL family protein N-acetyltransferase
MRPTILEDAHFILELVNSPKWIQFIGDRKVNSIEDAKEYIQNRIRPQIEEMGFGNYTVIRKSDQLKIGSCGLYDRDGINGLDLGFAFLPRYERNGYGFECASSLMRHAFKNHEIQELRAITLKNNIASQKLLSKLGFTFEKWVQIPNDDETLMCFHTLLA